MKRPQMNAPILALEKIRKRFGAIVIADGIDLALAEGEALGIIGPNGAGKTTLFGIVSGTVAPDSGRVLLCRPRHHARPAGATLHAWASGDPSRFRCRFPA